jgi:hypothetical protein
MDDYREANMKDARPNLMQIQPSTQVLSGIKERMSRLIAGSLDIKSELEKHRVELDFLRQENRELKTLVQSTLEQLNSVYVSQMRVELGMKNLMRKWALPFGASTPVLLERDAPSVSPDSPLLRTEDNGIAETQATQPTAAVQPMQQELQITPQAPAMLTARTLNWAALNLSSNKKGKRNPQHAVQSVLRRMYEEHRNIAFAALADGVTHELSNQTTWVWNNMFSASSSKDILKIQRALTLIDCIWTAEERRILVHHLKPVGEVIPICKIIQNRVVQAAHVLQKKEPKTSTPSQRATGGLLGIANSIGLFELEPYLPNWDDDGKTPCGQTLTELVEQKTLEIQNKSQCISNN